MTYKRYKIVKKDEELFPNLIRFELNGLVEFSNGGKQDFVFLDKLPFKNYQVGDEIEIDGNNMEVRGVKKYSKNVPEDMDVDNSSQLDGEKGKEKQFQTQEQVDLLVSAYDKKVAYQVFRSFLEWLEKYIEIVHPNYRIDKQIHDKNIKRQDANDPNKIKRFLSSSLYGFKTAVEVINSDEQSKKSLCNEIKKEYYYKWLDASRINPNACPIELKHFLFEVNEVLEGRGDKIEKDIENRKWEIDPNSREYEEAVKKVFSSMQTPLENERKEYGSLKGKTYKDIKIENNFESSGKKAEQAFKQMAGQHEYQEFNFVTQRERNPNYNPLIDDPSEEFLGSSSSTGISNTTQPSNSQPNVSHLTGQELKDNYVPVNNDRQVSSEQLGEMQQVERNLMNSEVPLNTAIPVANGSLAFVLASSGGILWFKRKISRWGW